jgi:Rieske Fe-S protein
MNPGAQDEKETREEADETTGSRCEVCGNVYDKAFQVVVAGTSRTFDSFECAIQALAPVCGHCGCRVIGHGVEAAAGIYCCAHCAKQEGIQEVRDRVA